jgi:hypothetical protein
MRFGIQLYPPCTAPEMADYAKQTTAHYLLDKGCVADHLTHENVFVILAAIIGRTDAQAARAAAQSTK